MGSSGFSPRVANLELEERLYAAEAQLWELALDEQRDMLLPPSLLQATIGDALAERKWRVKSDTSYLHNRPRAPARGGGAPRRPSPRAQSARPSASQRGGIPLPLPPPSVVPPPSAAPPAAAAVAVGQQQQQPHGARAASPRHTLGGDGSGGGSATMPPSRHRRLAPPSRADVHAIEAALNRRLRSEGETMAAYDAALEGVIEQVGAACIDRGHLLGRIRQWLLQHVWWQEGEVRRARQEAHLAAERAEALEQELEELRQQLSRAPNPRTSMAPNPRTSISRPNDAPPRRLSYEARASRERSVAAAAAAADPGEIVSHESVLSYVDGLPGNDVAQLLDRLVDQLANNTDPSEGLLTSIVVTALSQLPTTEIADAMRTSPRREAHTPDDAPHSWPSCHSTRGAFRAGAPHSPPPTHCGASFLAPPFEPSS